MALFHGVYTLEKRQNAWVIKIIQWLYYALMAMLLDGVVPLKFK